MRPLITRMVVSTAVLGMVVASLYVFPDLSATEVQAPDVSVTVSDIARNVERRFDKYTDLEFIYRVTTEASASPDAPRGTTSPLITDGVLKTNDVFRILGRELSQQADSKRPKRCWIRRMQDAEGNTILHRFVSFDGTVTRQLRRDARTGTPVGQVLSSELPHACNENVFDQFLFLCLNGTSRSIDANDVMREFNLSQYQIVDTKHVDGRTKFNLRAQGLANGNSAFDKIEYNVEVTGEPEFMVLRWEAKDTKDNRRLALYEVKETKTFESLPYPAAGSYRQWPVGSLPKHAYDFRVVRVKRISDKAKKNWAPAWPSGTIVQDNVGGKNLRVE